MNRERVRVTKPTKIGRFLLSERFKNGGRFAQLKFGRRLLLEVQLGIKDAFQATDAYKTLKKQAEELHSSAWSPPPPKPKSAVRISQKEFEVDGTAWIPKPETA